MASYETEPPPPEPGGATRRRSSIFIAVFVILQFLVPLTYLAREDASDDRFTWRSFTEPVAPACDMDARVQRFGEDPKNVDLATLLHEDWLRYLQLGRRSVIDAFMLSQCETEGVEKVELVSRCGDERDTRSFSLRCGGERAHETTRTASR